MPNLIQKLQKDSKFLRRLGLFSRTEATSKANLESAVQGLKAARVISVTDKSKRIELQEKPLEQIELLLKINDAVQHWMLAEQQALLRDQFARSG